MSDYDPFKVQVGGNHYAKYAIQPTEYITKNNMPFAEGCVVKYVTRWKDKNGIEDLRKAKHYIELLIALEERKEQEKEEQNRKHIEQLKEDLIREIEEKGRENFRINYNGYTTSVMELNAPGLSGTDVIFTGKLEGITYDYYPEFHKDLK